MTAVHDPALEPRAPVTGLDSIERAIADIQAGIGRVTCWTDRCGR